MSLRCLAPIFIAMTSSAAVAEGYPATTKSACEQEQFPSGNTAANIKTPKPPKQMRNNQQN